MISFNLKSKSHNSVMQGRALRSYLYWPFAIFLTKTKKIKIKQEHRERERKKRGGLAGVGGEEGQIVSGAIRERGSPGSKTE